MAICKLSAITAALIAVASASFGATITGYNVYNADPSLNQSNPNTTQFRHIYSGTITPSVTFAGLEDLTGGIGSMADGIIPSNLNGAQAFYTPDSVANILIELFFDQTYTFETIALFNTSLDIANNIPGNVSGFDVTVGTATASVITTGFGPVTTNENPGQNVHDRASFAGTAVAGIGANTLTLSNFLTQDSSNQNRFSIAEIVVTGQPFTPVPLPASMILLGAGLLGMGAFGRVTRRGVRR